MKKGFLIVIALILSSITLTQAQVSSIVRGISIINPRVTPTLDSDTILPNTTVGFRKVTNDIVRRFRLTAQAGDSLSFKTNLPCSISVCNSNMRIMHTAYGDAATSFGGFHVSHGDTYYVEVSDATYDGLDSLFLEYQHFDKYAILSQNVDRVGNGGLSAITFRGNGFDRIITVQAVLDTDTIPCHYHTDNSRTKMKVVWDFEHADTGLYSLAFCFESDTLVLPDALSIEPAQDIILDTSVTCSNTLLSDSTITYTFTVTNTGNMTAFNLPLSISLVSDSINDISKVNLDGLGLTSISEAFSKDSLTSAQVQKIRQFEAEIGDTYRFFPTEFFDSISQTNKAALFTFFTLSLNPFETKTIQVTITASNHVYAYFSMPDTVHPMQIIRFDSSAISTNGAKSGESYSYSQDHFCCLAPGLSCIANIVSTAGDLFKLDGGLIGILISCVLDEINLVIDKMMEQLCPDNENLRNPDLPIIFGSDVETFSGIMYSCMGFDFLDNFLEDFIFFSGARSFFGSFFNCLFALSQRSSYCPTQYTIDVLTESSAKGTVKGGGTKGVGRLCTISATPKPGYVFRHWKDINTGEVFSKSSYQSFRVERDLTLKAYFDVKTYNVNLSCCSRGGGSVSGGGKLPEGNTTIHAYPNSGYQFDYWFDVDDSTIIYEDTYSFYVDRDRTFVAWFSSIGGSGSVTDSTVPSHRIYFGSYPSEGGHIEERGRTVETGYFPEGSHRFKAVCNPYYQFNYWIVGTTQGTSADSILIDLRGEKIIVASFSRKKYTINVSSESNSKGSVSGSGKKNAGEDCTVTATAWSGYMFLYWKIAGTDSIVSRDRQYTFNVTRPVNLIANFTSASNIRVYTNNRDHGSVSGPGYMANGQFAMVVATPNPNYKFVGWEEYHNTIVSFDSAYTFTVERDRELTAYFAPKTYTITAQCNPPEGGTATGGGVKYAGTTCTLVAGPNQGYVFDCWKDGSNIVSTNNRYSFTVDGNRPLTACFKRIYEITLTSSPDGKATLSGYGLKHANDQCTVSVNPRNNYRFKRWSENGLAASYFPTYTFTITSDRNLVAELARTYTITVRSEDSTKGNVSGGGTCDSGSTCTIRAKGENGYEFDYWSTGFWGLTTVRNNPYTFSVTDDKKYTAHFKRVSKSGGNYGGNDVGESTYDTAHDVMMEEGNFLPQLQNKASKLIIYPNPTTGQFVICEPDVQVVEVFDNTGRMMAKFNNTSVISISDFPAGFYILRVTTRKETKVGRVVKH